MAAKSPTKPPFCEVARAWLSLRPLEFWLALFSTVALLLSWFVAVHAPDNNSFIDFWLSAYSIILLLASVVLMVIAVVNFCIGRS